MREIIRMITIEFQIIIKNKKFIASMIVYPLIMVLIFTTITVHNTSKAIEPVKVCAPQEYREYVESAGGVLTSKDCNVIIIGPDNVIYRLDIYENTQQINHMKNFVDSFRKLYYSVPEEIHETAIVNINGVEVSATGDPSKVYSSILGAFIAIPILLFFVVVTGTEYVNSSIVSQKEKHILDLLMSLPVKRRNILLSKIITSIIISLFVMFLYSAAIVAIIIETVPIDASQTNQAPTPPISLGIIASILSTTFTYFVTGALALKSKDTTSASTTTPLVSTILSFSLMIPPLTGSMSILKSDVIPLLIPTLIPIKVALLQYSGNITKAAVYITYLLLTNYVLYRIMMKSFEE